MLFRGSLYLYLLEWECFPKGFCNCLMGQLGFLILGDFFLFLDISCLLRFVPFFVSIILFSILSSFSISCECVFFMFLFISSHLSFVFCVWLSSVLKVNIFVLFTYSLFLSFVFFLFLFKFNLFFFVWLVLYGHSLSILRRLR